MSTAKVPTFNLDPFAMRQFDDPNYTGTRVNHDKAAFAAKINELYDSGGYPLVDGYAPFCKCVRATNPQKLCSLRMIPTRTHERHTFCASQSLLPTPHRQAHLCAQLHAGSAERAAHHQGE